MSLFDQLLAALPGAPSQHQRLIRLHTPMGFDVMLAERMSGVEAIFPGDVDARDQPLGLPATEPPKAGFRFVIHALASDTHHELKRLVGQPVLLELLTQASRTQLRPFHGHVMEARLEGSDGGLARYRLVVEPWLFFMSHQQDSRVFQDMSVPQIIDDVFSCMPTVGRIAPAWRWDLADESVYPRRSLCIQYQETDLDFVKRLMLEEGLFAWWEFEGDAQANNLGKHTLVLADHNGAVRPNSQPIVRYTQSGAAMPEDSLVRWREKAQLLPCAIRLASFDYRSLQMRNVGQAGAALNGRLPDLASELVISDVPGIYAYEDLAQGQRLALRQMQAVDSHRLRARASGSWRTASVGTAFMLADHPRHDGTNATRDTFVTLAVSHQARSNVSADLKAQVHSLLGAIQHDKAGRAATGESDRLKPEEPEYVCELLAQPLSMPVRPSVLDENGIPDVRIHPRPTVVGTQTAIVVGPADGSAIHTDRDHRVRIQFHWQRGSQSSHRVTAVSGADNAPANETSGTWVRVAQAVAGDNWGQVFTPRVGQEVLVSFVEGDIDRPVIIGAVYNGKGQADQESNQLSAGAAKASGNAPAWFPGSEAEGKLQGHQHPAVLSGFKSQELSTSKSGTGGSNQLVFDDTPGQGRIELSTTAAQTHLQIGHLLNQTGNRRLQSRGHGLDLATQAWGAVRAGSGLLLSAHGLMPSTAAGRQMDASEAQQSMEQSAQLAHTLARSAQQHLAKIEAEPELAEKLATEPKLQLQVEAALTSTVDSLKHTASSQGNDSEAIAGGHGTVAAWLRPDMVVGAPGGVAMFTPAHGIFTAGATAAFVSGQDHNQLSIRHSPTVVKSGVVFYTYGKATSTSKPSTATGIAMHAASGSVNVQAQSGAAKLTADKSVDVSSTQGKVLASAREHVLLAAGGAAIRIEGDSITLTAPGKVEFRAGMKELGAGATASQQFQLTHQNKPLSPSEFDDRLIVRNDAGAPMPNRRYEITREDGAVLRGTTGADGRIEQQVSFKGERIQVKVLGKK